MEAELKFEKENISGIGVVGTYLIDAAKRLGVEIAEESGRLGLTDETSLIVKSGGEFLNLPTKAELEVLSAERRANGERLACQAKITGEGEIVIETKEKPEPPKIDKNEEYKQEFSELPLEKKISNLLELETIALGDTVSFIMNSPYAVVGKVIDVLAEFGLKIDGRAKDADATDKKKKKSAKHNGKHEHHEKAAEETV